MRDQDLKNLEKIIKNNPNWVQEFNAYNPRLGKEKLSKLMPMPKPTTPHVCPVCQGRGNVPAGFYMRSSATSSASPEQCKSCNGSGVIFS